MSILDTIAEDEKTLAELLKGDENGSIEETIEQEETADSGDSGDTEASGDETAEEVTEEQAEPEKPKEELDNRGYARLRRESTEWERKAKELEERLKVIEQRPEPQKEQSKDVEPDVKKDPVAWLEWNDRQNKTEIAELKAAVLADKRQKEETDLIERAKEEFTQYEDTFKSTKADYEDVAEFAFKKIAESLQIVNPSLSGDNLVRATQRHILQLAANYHAQGLNPAEEIYFDAKEKLGYQPKEVKQEPIRRDLNKVAENRKRNAGTASAVGAGSKPQITKEVAAKMSIAEFAQLSQDDLRAIGM
jgi:hypothetical protein